MEKINWTIHVRNEKLLHKVKEERNILHTKNRKKANLVSHILRRNCLLKQVIEGKIEGEIEVTEREGRRSKHLLDDLQKTTEWYWKLKQAAPDRNLWKTRFGRGYEPVVR
jgi:hypothetical protein